jgi:prophage regulatory protein
MKFLKLTEVMALTGLSRSSVYLAISEGKFPRQVSLGVRSVAWVSNEIEDWMENCVSNRGSIQ